MEKRLTGKKSTKVHTETIFFWDQPWFDWPGQYYKINKAVYTPPQSRKGGQEQKTEMLQTDQQTDTASSRVASPRLKIVTTPMETI